MIGLELGFELAFEVGFGLGLGSRRLQVCFRRISPVEDGECLAQGGAELDRRAVLGLGLLTATLAAALAAAPTAALLSAVHSSRTFARRARALCLTSLQERNHPTPTRAIAFDFCQEDARGTLFFHQASTRLGAQRRKKGLATGCPLVLPGAQGTRVEPMGRCWSPSSTHQALRRRAKKSWLLVWDVLAAGAQVTPFGLIDDDGRRCGHRGHIRPATTAIQISTINKHQGAGGQATQPKRAPRGARRFEPRGRKHRRKEREERSIEGGT